MIRWSQSALADLSDIAAYIAEDNPRVARAWVARLRTRLKRVAEMPRAGRRVPEYGQDSLREVLVRSYRIVYRIEPGGIQVLAVIEGHRTLTSLD